MDTNMEYMDTDCDLDHCPVQSPQHSSSPSNGVAPFYEDNSTEKQAWCSQVMDFCSEQDLDQELLDFLHEELDSRPVVKSKRAKMRRSSTCYFLDLPLKPVCGKLNLSANLDDFDLDSKNEDYIPDTYPQETEMSIDHTPSAEHYHSTAEVDSKYLSHIITDTPVSKEHCYIDSITESSSGVETDSRASESWESIRRDLNVEFGKCRPQGTSSPKSVRRNLARDFQKIKEDSTDYSSVYSPRPRNSTEIFRLDNNSVRLTDEYTSNQSKSNFSRDLTLDQHHLNGSPKPWYDRSGPCNQSCCASPVHLQERPFGGFRQSSRSKRSEYDSIFDLDDSEWEDYNRRRPIVGGNGEGLDHPDYRLNYGSPYSYGTDGDSFYSSPYPNTNTSYNSVSFGSNTMRHFSDARSPHNNRFHTIGSSNADSYRRNNHAQGQFSNGVTLMDQNGYNQNGHSDKGYHTLSDSDSRSPKPRTPTSQTPKSEVKFVEKEPIRGRRYYRTLKENGSKSKSSASKNTKDGAIYRYVAGRMYCILPDSVYERGLGERRGSVPVVSAAGQEENMADPPSTPSRLASFFSRKVIKSNLKRTKSVTKLDRKRPNQNDLEGSPNLVSTLKRSMSLGRLTKRWSSKQRPHFDDAQCKNPVRTPLDNRELINARMRTSRSHESLLTTHSAMHSIDLADKEVEIKPLHSSILGQEHCFQVSTSHGSKYYSCRTAEERQKWIQCLRKTVHPEQEKSRRTENSLKIWILEAKNVAPKKRYFCEVCLDKALYARTSTIQKNDMLFWGENFDFSNIPDIETITVNLYREADKKKKKEKNCLLGYINIPVAEITNRQLVEKWYTASSAYVGSRKENKSDLPLLRVKARYQTVNILPMDCYQDFFQYLQNNYMSLVETLEPVVSVKAKEELALSLVRAMHRSGQPATFLADIVMAELDKLDNENLTFRGNSIATKAMEAYMKLIGERYLQDTLGDFVRTLLESADDCEVDPARLGGNNATLQRHQQNLVMYCEMAWFKIINSYCFFPMELREVFCTVKERCMEKKQGEVSDNLISSCIFLRFLCPSILSPSLFNLTQTFPQDRSARNLTLIAKTIQNLANFTKFGAKEDYMTFMNDFVEREFDSMTHYLQKISSRDTQTAAQDFDGYIDLGQELSLLHTILSESLEKITNEASQQKMSKLSEILEEVSEILANPNLTLRRKASKGTTNEGAYRIYDNVSALRQQQQQQANYQDASLSNSTDNMQPSGGQAPSQTIVSGSYAHGSHQTAAADLTTADDYVMFSALNGQPSACGVQASATPQRLNEQEVNQSWNKIVSAANMVNGDYIDLVSFMDEFESQNSSTELDNGSQVSIGQLSTVASSGYQSFGYSQSSSPVDSGVQADLVTPVSQPLSFSNPLFGHSSQSGTMSSSGSSTRERKQRTASSSSLSSEESSPIHSSHNPHPHVAARGVLPPASSSSLSHPHESNTGPHHPPHEHPHRLPKNLSCSSSSCESLKDLKCQSPPAHHHLNGRLANGSTASAPLESSTPIAHSQSVSRTRGASNRSSNNSNNMQSNRSHSPHSYQSNTWSKSYKNSPLSRSIDLGQPSSRQNAPSPTMYHSQPPPPSPHHYKPVVAETLVIPPSPASPAIDHAPVYGPRRTAVPQNTVRMGVRSVQRRHNDIEKSKAEYEQELSSLRQQLAVTQAMLAEAQAKLMTQEATPEESQWSGGEEQKEGSENFEKIIDSLQEELEVKEQKIHDQERQIHQLDAANAQLMAVVNQLKDMPPISRNGLLATSTKLSLADSGQFKSSSC